MIHDGEKCDCDLCRWATDVERRQQEESEQRRKALAEFVTCPHYDHRGIDCPMVQAQLERENHASS